MISETTQSLGTRTQSTDPDARYREDVLMLLVRLDLEPTRAITLLEAATGRPFDACSPTQLVPLLQELLEFVQSHRNLVDTNQPWHA